MFPNHHFNKEYPREKIVLLDHSVRSLRPVL